MRLFVFSPLNPDQAPLNGPETKMKVIGPYADKDNGAAMAENTFGQNAWTRETIEVAGETLEDQIASAVPQLCKFSLKDGWELALATFLQTNPALLRQAFKAIRAFARQQQVEEATNA